MALSGPDHVIKSGSQKGKRLRECDIKFLEHWRENPKVPTADHALLTQVIAEKHEEQERQRQAKMRELLSETKGMADDLALAFEYIRLSIVDLQASANGTALDPTAPGLIAASKDLAIELVREARAKNRSVKDALLPHVMNKMVAGGKLDSEAIDSSKEAT